MATYFSDLHCHTTQFGFNRMYPNPWHEPYFPLFPAQGDYAQLAKGKVRVVMASLYPVEQGFVDVEPLNLGTGEVTDFLTKFIVNIPKRRSDEIQSYDHDYFEDLVKEINYLNRTAYPRTKKIFVAPFKRKKFRYKIMGDFDELKSALDLDADLNPGPGCEDTIAVVLTIEGAHSIGTGQKNTLEMDPSDLEQRVIENIDKLKKLGPPGEEGKWCPFFVSLSHHFWNQLGGHSVSLYKIIRKVLDQKEGINTGITPLGELVVDKFLDKSNGQKRILIDIAHMSIKVRRWYFDYLEQRGDDIPIFASHTGVNGFTTMDEAEMHGTPDTIHEVADELYEQSDEFNPWDIFLSNEEIMKIHNSGGIIGLNMDERIMMGKKSFDHAKEEAKNRSKKEDRKVWIRPLVNEILHIANHIFNETGQSDHIWDNISIGSDYNGMIKPIKTFKTAKSFPELNDALAAELKNCVITEPLLAGKSDQDIDEITDKIMWKNNLRFLEKHFHN